MGRVSDRYCRACGRDAEACGPISARGRCAECADLIMEANTEGMRERRGPFYLHWIDRTQAALERERQRAAAE